jgi:hypothetical protein
MISSIATWYNSRSATTYHIGYPAVARSVFGMWGSFYVVGARAALAIIWYGIQTLSGFIVCGKHPPCNFWSQFHIRSKWDIYQHGLHHATDDCILNLLDNLYSVYFPTPVPA